jgi:mannan endo-1,4-beta-mannosidase
MLRRCLASALLLALSACGETHVGEPAEPSRDQDAAMAQMRITLDGHRYYMNGINLAWNNWSRDLSPGLGGYEPDVFEEVFSNLESYGGNSLRLWIHCDGTSSPVYDEQNVVPIGLQDGTLDSLRDLLARAAAHRVRVLFSLWSFGLQSFCLQQDRTTHKCIAYGTHGQVVTDPTNTQAYIDNVLTGLVTTAKGSPGLFGWEICNEPQFMTEGYPQGTLPRADVVRFHAMLAAAIHRADPDALVTTGDYMPEISAAVTTGGVHMSDSDLAAAVGGDPLAHLDFYTLHNYQLPPSAPWLHDAAWYMLGKPLVIGEFEAKGYKNWSSTRMYQWAHDHGYAGALSWAYLDNRGDHTGTFWDASDAMLAVYQSDPSAIFPTPAPVAEGGSDANAVDAPPDQSVDATDDGSEAASPDAGEPDATLDAAEEAQEDADTDAGD